MVSAALGGEALFFYFLFYVYLFSCQHWKEDKYNIKVILFDVLLILAYEKKKKKDHIEFDLWLKVRHNKIYIF